MKIIAFNGSARADGNTHKMIEAALAPLLSAGFDCEEIHIGAEMIYGCRACRSCHKTGHCVITDDKCNIWADMMRASNAVILASPAYYANVSGQMKTFMDRVGFMTGTDLKHKIGAPIAVHRRMGGIQVYNALMAFFGIKNMIVPMSTYWNLGVGLNPGDVLNDEEGMRTMKNLGDCMVWLLNKLA